MLVLTRKDGEAIEVDGPATITVLERHGNRTKIGIEADRVVNIRRSELPPKGDGCDRENGQETAD